MSEARVPVQCVNLQKPKGRTRVEWHLSGTEVSRHRSRERAQEKNKAKSLGKIDL